MYDCVCCMTQLTHSQVNCIVKVTKQICVLHDAHCKQLMMYTVSPIADSIVGVCRQEGMSSILAAGGLLEGLARGTAALAPASPACQALSHILTQACTRSLSSTGLPKPQRQHQAANQSVSHGASSAASDKVDATLEADLGCPTEQQHAGIAIRQGAAAIACCQTWQVSVTVLVRHPSLQLLRLKCHPLMLNAFLSNVALDCTLYSACLGVDYRLHCVVCLLLLHVSAAEHVAGVVIASQQSVPLPCQCCMTKPAEHGERSDNMNVPCCGSVMAESTCLQPHCATATPGLQDILQTGLLASCWCSSSCAPAPHFTP